MADANDTTLTSYQAAAGIYAEQTRHPLSPAMQTYLDAIAAVTVPGGYVLELGSGPGREALALEARGLRVRRTDATPAFVEMMRADGHEAEELNLLTDEFDGGPYDLVFASAVLLHVPRGQLGAVLGKAAGVVRPHGVLAFSVKEGDGEEWAHHQLDRPRHFTFWHAPELAAVVDAAGWTVLDIEFVVAPRADWLYVIARLD